MPSLSSGLVDEVGVIARNADSLLKNGSAKPHNVARNVGENLNGLALGDLHETAIGRRLARNRSRSHKLKVALNAKGVEIVVRRGQAPEEVAQLGQGVWLGDALCDVRLESRDHRERRLNGGERGSHTSVAGQAVTRAVNDEHLAVKRVERADTKVSARQQVLDRTITLINAVEQRPHSAGLKDFVPFQFPMRCVLVHQLGDHRAERH